jgi:hypothetical protein
MWKSIEFTSNKNYNCYGIQEDGSPITLHQFLTLLKNSSPFRRFYNQKLADCNFKAFLWENKPMTRANLDQTYEYSLVKNNYLVDVLPDQHTFQQYFDSEQQAVTFQNLGGDAQLIAPCPHHNPDCYTHIGTFVRNTPAKQRDAFWKITGEQMLDAIGNEPKWLSTNGMGVSWLHMRIDRRPKYYQTQKYRSFPPES